MQIVKRWSKHYAVDDPATNASDRTLRASAGTAVPTVKAGPENPELSELSPEAAALWVENLHKTFHGNSAVHALNGLSLAIARGEIFGVIGMSGAGKSTLIRCLNRLVEPDAGRILLQGEDLLALSERELRQRRRKIGMIFQSFNLFTQRSALENVVFPLRLAGISCREARTKASQLLERVGLGDKLNAYPAQLSGGQQQRVGIARALANDPLILLCDEATSALDPQSTRAILDLLKTLNSELGLTIVMITHQMEVVSQICDRVAVMETGQVVETGPVAEVFRRPRSALAKQLVFPKGALLEQAENVTLRIAFDGHAATEPILSRLILASGAELSILSADSRNIDGVSYGQMVLTLPQDPGQRQQVVDWLEQEKLDYSIDTLEPGDPGGPFQPSALLESGVHSAFEHYAKEEPASLAGRKGRAQ